MVLTDGSNTTGVDPVTAAEQAAARRLRVFTIGFGTTEPAAMVCSPDQVSGDNWRGGGGGFGRWGDDSGLRRVMQIDEETLTQVADTTGGKYFRAEDAGQLTDVLTDLPSEIGLHEAKRRDDGLVRAVRHPAGLRRGGTLPVVEPGPGAKVSHAVDLRPQIADLASAFLTQAVVTRKTALSDHFVRVDLRSDKFRSASRGRPAARSSSGRNPAPLGMRTYTPFAWNAAEGTTSLVGYVHGTGPASRLVRPGEARRPLRADGPAPLLDLSGPGVARWSSSATSPASAWPPRSARPGPTASPTSWRPPTRPNTPRSWRVWASPRRSCRRTVATCSTSPGSGAYDLVVTGDAATVGPLRRAARDRTPRLAKILGKAYWAEGRTGASTRW